MRAHDWILLGLLCSICGQARSACETDEESETTCRPTELIIQSGAPTGSGRLFDGFQPPVLFDDDSVGFVALTDSASFLYEAFVRTPDGSLVDALVRGAMAEGDFQGISQQTLDVFGTLATDASGNFIGPVFVYDEFGTPIRALARGGIDGYSLVADPPGLAADEFLSVSGDTLLVANAVGDAAYKAEFRSSSGVLVREAIVTTSGGILASSGAAGPLDATEYLGFFSPNVFANLAINRNAEVAFSALLSNADGFSVVDAASNEVLVRQSGAALVVIAQEGDALADLSTPNVTIGNAADHTFNYVSLNDRRDVSFLTRILDGPQESEFLTGGSQAGNDYDAIGFAAGGTLGFDILVARGDMPDSVGFDAARLPDNSRVSRLSVPRLNNAGDLAYFLNVGEFANDTADGLGLFRYDSQTDVTSRIFQTSGATIEDILLNGDSVDGLTFFTSDGFFNELAINDAGDVAFTSLTVADEFSPSRNGLFLYQEGQIDAVALEGASFEVQPGDVRTIRFIEFQSGSSSSGRPSGLNNEGSITYGVVFDDFSSGVFLDTFEFVPVEDFLWSGDCGSSNWHDPCGTLNWVDRQTRDPAPRNPGTEANDRAFIEAADVVISDQPVTLFSLQATGSLSVSQALTLSSQSSIENLMLDGDLTVEDVLTVGGSASEWRGGRIAGAGEVRLVGNAMETGRLVFDSGSQTARLDGALTLGDISEFAFDGGSLDLGTSGSIELLAADASLVLGSGRITADGTDYRVIVPTGQVVKSTAGEMEVAAGYQQTAGALTAFAGRLLFSGPVALEGSVLVEDGAEIALDGGGAPSPVILGASTLAGEGVLAFGNTEVQVNEAVSSQLAGDGGLVLTDGAEVFANGNLTVEAGSILRKRGAGESILRGSRLEGNVLVESGTLDLRGVAVPDGAEVMIDGDATVLNDAEITIDDGATLNLSDVVAGIDGSTEISGEGTVRVGAGARVVNVDDDARLINGARMSVAGGRISGSQDPAVSEPITLVNDGELHFSSGTLGDVVVVNGAVDDLISTPGLFVIPQEDGARLLEGDVTISNRAGSVARLLGAVDVASALSISNSGDMQVDGAFDAVGPFPSTFELTNQQSGVLRVASPRLPGRVDNNGLIEVTGDTEVDRLVMRETGRLLLDGTSASVGLREEFSGTIDLRNGALLEAEAVDLGLVDPFGLLQLSTGRYLIRDSELVIVEGAFPGLLGSIGREAYVELIGANARIGDFALAPSLRIDGEFFLLGSHVETSSPDGGYLISRFGEMVLETGSSAAGPTMTNEGTLRLNGGILDVGRFVDSGRLVVGASPGLATVTGDYDKTGGILEMEIGGTEPGVTYDQLIVGGTATFQPGSTIDISLIDPDPTDGVDEIFRPSSQDTFELIRAADLVLADGLTVDELFTFSNAPAGLRFDVGLEDDGGSLRLLLNILLGIDPALLDGLAPNARTWGEYINGLLLGDAAAAPALVDSLTALGGLNGPGLAAELVMLSPEAYASSSVALLTAQSEGVQQALSRRWADHRRQAGPGVWLDALTHDGALDGSDTTMTADVDTRVDGVIVGGDLVFENGAFIGAFIGDASGDHDTQAGGSGDYDGLLFGVYGGAQWAGASLAGYAAYNDGEVDGERRLAGAAVGSTTVGDEYDLDAWLAQLELRLPSLIGNDALALYPTVGVGYERLTRGSIREGGGELALRVDSDDYERLVSDVGVRVDIDWETESGGTWLLETRAGWRYDHLHQVPVATASFEQATSPDGVRILGTRMPRNWGYAGLGATYATPGGVRVGLRYDRTFADRLSNGTAHLSVVWPF